MILALVVGLCVIQPRLNAQDQTPSQQQPPDPAAQPQSMNQAADSQTFSGKITKSGGKYVLKDSASKATYALDDQEKAKQFEGQTVQVTGTLDAQTQMIRIASISPGS
jgi:lipopolysaccharide export system protein LptA